MGLPLNIEITQSPPPGISKRKFREISREAHRRVGNYWHKNFLPLHFRSGAAERYNYQPRTEGYKKRKKRLARKGKVKMRGTVPLVFSGLMRDLLKRPQIVKAFPTRASLKMPGPRYVSMRPKTANRPNLGEEATRTTAQERQVLTGIYEKTIDDLMSQRKPERHRL